MTRIALIHALRESVAPINAAFNRLWPEAERMNLLDDSLSADRARDSRLTEAMIGRFVTLGRYAGDAGVDAILFTCSAFGPAIDAVAADLALMPVHKPNSAMVAATAGYARVGLLASFGPTLESMVPEFAAEQQIMPCHCSGALEALAAGNGAEHDRIAADAAVAALADCDVIALAQFSLARAAASVAAATGKPVLTTPDCAVEALRVAMDRPVADRLPR